jgi:YD repeat-containing protein
MTTVECKVGDHVRLKQDLPVAVAGTEGVVQRLVYDAQDQVTAVVILLDFGGGDKRGTTVFPHEVEKV